MASRRQKKKNAKKTGNCALCGKPLPKAEGERVIGITGHGVCGNCLSVSKHLIYRAPKVDLHVPKILSAGEIKAELDKSIIGQEQAKNAVSICLWKQQLRSRGIKMPSSNLMLYGPTGCGKTAIISQAAKVLNLPFMAFDATTFSEAGYKGRDAKDIVSDLIDRFSRYNVKYAVIFIDEVDKLSAKGSNDRQAYNRGTQHSFLKLIEGTEVNGISTAEMQFIFGGAFNAISSKSVATERHIGFERPLPEINTLPLELSPNDFVDYGMEPEFMGRIGRCVPIQALTEIDLRRIMYESELSAFVLYCKYFESYGIKLELTSEEEKRIIARAVSNKMGARSLNALIEEWIEPKLIQLSEEIMNGKAC